MNRIIFAALLTFSTHAFGVNVIDYGARNDGVGDCGPAFITAASQLELDKGGVITVPPGTYNFETPFQIPQFKQGAIVDFEMTGAVLKTTNGIAIFDRFPATQSEASTLVGAVLRFNGGRFVGSGLASQTGIRLSCTYCGSVSGTAFESLGVGLDAYFCLGLRVFGSRSGGNLVADWRLQSGTNSYTGIGWQGAAISNSACNMSVIDGCRSYASNGQQYQLGIFSSSGVVVNNCIFEGGNPTNNIRFDWLHSSTVKDFRVINTHTENTPKDAVVYGAWTGLMIIDGLYRPNSPIINAVDAWAGSQLVVKNVPYISYAGSTVLFKCNGFYAPNVAIENLGANGIASLTTNLWEGGKVSAGSQQWSTFYAPPKLVPLWEFKTAYTGDAKTTNASAWMVMANSLSFLTDDLYSFGAGGRPKSISVGSGGIKSGGNVTLGTNVLSFSDGNLFWNGKQVTTAP